MFPSKCALFRLIGEKSKGIHWIEDGKGLSIDQSRNETFRIAKNSCVQQLIGKKGFNRGHIIQESKTHHTRKKMTRWISFKHLLWLA